MRNFHPKEHGMRPLVAVFPALLLKACHWRRARRLRACLCGYGRGACSYLTPGFTHHRARSHGSQSGGVVGRVAGFGRRACRGPGWRHKAVAGVCVCVTGGRVWRHAAGPRWRHRPHACLFPDPILVGAGTTPVEILIGRASNEPPSCRALARERTERLQPGASPPSRFGCDGAVLSQLMTGMSAAFGDASSYFKARNEFSAFHSWLMDLRHRQNP